MRTFHITGTMAASVSGGTEDDLSDGDLSTPSDVKKRKFLAKCIKSWYGRFKGISAMHEGTMNEEPTADTFSLEPMVLEFHEAGLLQCNSTPFIAVSPDGVAVMLIDGRQHLACVEIKTRVAENMIA
jgi:hypothetical protein